MKPFVFSIGLICGLILLAGCGPSDRVEITETSERSTYRPADTPGATSKERFGNPLEEASFAQGHSADDGHDHSDPNHTHAEDETSEQMAYRVPDGWTEVAPTQFRNPNFTAGPNNDVECYATTMPAGGSVPDNITRWRGQFNLEPFTDEQFAGLPRFPILGSEAVLVNLKGTFKTMQGELKENYHLLGAIIPLPDNLITLKMIGPAAQVQGEVGNFASFLQSLGGGNPDAEAAPASGQPIEDKIPGVAINQLSKNGMSWKIPEGWNFIDTGSPMRVVTFRMGKDLTSECYIVTLGGTGGGRLLNMNRWLGQLGQTPLEESELELQPKVEVFGEEVPMLITRGEFTGMQGEVVKQAMLLGATAELEEFSVFIKLIGPAQDVQQELGRFRAFCASLKQD
jgi:hypothetical protein